MIAHGPANLHHQRIRCIADPRLALEEGRTSETGVVHLETEVTWFAYKPAKSSGPIC
jgi:hypothetical protein